MEVPEDKAPDQLLWIDVESTESLYQHVANASIADLKRTYAHNLSDADKRFWLTLILGGHTRVPCMYEFMSKALKARFERYHSLESEKSLKNLLRIKTFVEHMVGCQEEPGSLIALILGESFHFHKICPSLHRILLVAYRFVRLEIDDKGTTVTVLNPCKYGANDSALNFYICGSNMKLLAMNTTNGSQYYAFKLKHLPLSLRQLLSTLISSDHDRKIWTQDSLLLPEVALMPQGASISAHGMVRRHGGLLSLNELVPVLSKSSSNKRCQQNSTRSTRMPKQWNSLHHLK